MNPHELTNADLIRRCRAGDSTAWQTIVRRYARFGGDDYDRHAYDRHARVESRPSGTLVGTWVIGGITYMANESTVFERDYGDLSIGRCVEIEVSPGAPTIALEIETEEDYECSGRDGDDDDRADGELYGLISQISDGTREGIRTIDGADFIADLNTNFREGEGVFAVGAYVEVVYMIDTNNQRRIVEIETNVPPGAGDDARLGKTEGLGGGAQAATVMNAPVMNAPVMAAPVMAATDAAWTIDGQAYTVSPATQLLDEDAALTVGTDVYVNSYTDDSGGHVATFVRSVTIGPRVYIPPANR